MVGDTTNLVTNALITGKPISLPEDSWRWINTGIWPDKSSRNRYYSVASTPPPPNAHSSAIADASLILDDEVHPALNLQKDNNPIFNVFLSFYAEGSDIGVATLDMDLRKWRRLKFRFRHATAESPTITLTVTDYLSLVGSTITVVSSKVDHYNRTKSSTTSHLVEGTDWDAETDDATTAENIRAAIDAIVDVTATRVGAVVTVSAVIIVGPLAPIYWLTYISS
ncbi:unnamed protein product, partial [marine sediment metagenome]